MLKLESHHPVILAMMYELIPTHRKMIIRGICVVMIVLFSPHNTPDQRAQNGS